MTDDTENLVRSASRGDAPSIEALLQQNLGRLHAFLRLRAGKLIRAKESCADLVQSVCREVLQDLGDFEYRGDAAFRQWLYTTARRKLVDRHRFYTQQKRDGAREVQTPDAHGDTRAEADVLDAYRGFYTPSHDAVVKEELAAVEAAFDQLPEDYQEVVTLSRVVGLSHKEIAQAMGRTEVATRHLLARAMARLGSLLDRE
jgi:RNA polymerase sigma-70 factor (ECF subfamily)